MTRIKEAWIIGVAVRTPIGLGALAAGLSENGAEVLLEAGSREVSEAQIT